ncbi:hypothetical protein I5Q34_34185 [Streptomyces sp. AV19]|uniref:hypothetical protein n=1 Tax=Streptomyces sp. AV19 TaxID=2793068 RepID=UPI0018FE05AC|nr:hypothetical protein [Streptomyces sp. AV19]MBH1939250.1 hypothetical protein [Streptomyces sp. AV19]MDG4531650.1 hypothetical protein [Streptomyces sp. AV19]
MTAPPCPAPGKSRYATREAATSAARAQVAAGRILRPYQCPCGWWHLTKDDVEPAGPPAAETIAEITALDNDAFADLVRRDRRGIAHPHESEALRHPAVVRRWEEELTVLLVDLEAQFVQRAGDQSERTREWRGRAIWVRAELVKRRQEARALRKAANRERPRAVLPPGAGERELRRLAGETAVERLKAAHGPEFARYVAEECERLGVEPPASVRKYLPEQTAEARL